MRMVFTLLAAALLIAACTVEQSTEVNTGNTTPTGNVVRETQVIQERVEIPQGRARVITALTGSGAPAGISGVRITIDNVEVYGPTEGWVTINGDENTYDLLQSPGTVIPIGDRVINAGQYTMVRMKISSIDLVDAAGTRIAVLPTDTFVYNITLPMAAGDTSMVTFEMLLDQSIRRTADGRYVVLPVMRVLARSGATISVQQDRIVAVQGPIIVERVYGTTVRGETAPDVIVPPSTVIIVENGQIREQTTVNSTTVINNTVVTNTTVSNTVANNTVVQNNTTANGTANRTTRSTWPAPRNTTRTTTATNASANMTANVTV